MDNQLENKIIESYGIIGKALVYGCIPAFLLFSTITEGPRETLKNFAQGAYASNVNYGAPSSSSH